MFPFLEPINWFIIYTFWLTITFCFFLFLWMLKKLSKKFKFDYSIFSKNIIWYFLSIFIFSRLFYIIWKWNDLKYIKNPIEFFIMTDYNFSLFWAIFWFFIVFLINLKLRKEKLNKYINWIIISFIFILFVWYIWAFLWWQVYWRETSFWIEVLYTHPFSTVPYQIPIFPLAIVYSISFFILFSFLYISSMYIKTKWLLWYLWLIIFSCIILIFEFFSWKSDFLKNLININFSQFFSIILIFIWWYKLLSIFKKEK